MASGANCIQYMLVSYSPNDVCEFIEMLLVLLIIPGPKPIFAKAFRFRNDSNFAKNFTAAIMLKNRNPSRGHCTIRLLPN